MPASRRLARWLRDLADRIDGEGAPKLTHWTWTFELYRGTVFREDGRGCRVAYLGDEEYEKAHADADRPPPRVDWKALCGDGDPCEYGIRGWVHVPWKGWARTGPSPFLRRRKGKVPDDNVL